MSSPSDITPYDWFRRFFQQKGLADLFSSGASRGSRIRDRDFGDFLRDFDDMKKDIERAFKDQLKDFETKIPKDLVKEYETKDGRKVREFGPIVYGYSMNIGPDGKPQIREFGNVKSFAGRGFIEQPSISSEREPLIELSSTNDEVKIVAEMPGVSKENIRIDAYENNVEIKSEDPNRKYHKTVEVPDDIDLESAKSNYKNGILEITFKKKEQQKPKGRQINIE